MDQEDFSGDSTTLGAEDGDFNAQMFTAAAVNAAGSSHMTRSTSRSASALSLSSG